MRSPRMICCALFLLTLVGVSHAKLVEIPVPDAGFDDQVLSAGGYAYIGDGAWPGELDYPGPWQSGGGDAWIDNHYYVADGDLPAVSGDNKLYGNDGEEDFIYQILDETYIEGATYTLSVYEGSAWPDYDDGWWLYFTTEDHTNNLAEASGNGPVGTWEKVSLVYTATADDAGKKIGIKLKADHWVTLDEVALSAIVPTTISVDPDSDLAAANDQAGIGDTILFAEGTYNITDQLEIKDGVTYQGAGAGLTIIDGNDLTRAFASWGDRNYNNTNENPNDSGPKGWVLDGLTIQNCVADANDMFSYAGAAYNMLGDFDDNDNITPNGALDLEEADADADLIRLNGPDGIEMSIDDDTHRFDAMDTNNDGELSRAELEVQLLSAEVEFPDQARSGGALFVGNGSEGTIQNCRFLDNYTPAGGRHGGAIFLAGLSKLTINDCNFVGNYAVSPSATQTTGENSHGGHIKMGGNSASPDTPGTTLIANRCRFTGGKAHANGGAIQSWAMGSIIRLDACLFSNNSAGNIGTVIHIGHRGSSELTVTNSLFWNNNTSGNTNRLFHVTRNTSIVNCTFVGNEVTRNGMIRNDSQADTDIDGMDDEFSDITNVVNCLFVDNVVQNQMLRSRNSSFTIAATNCLFFGNMRTNGNAADNMQNGRPELGSIEEDPLLDATFYPGPGSPAIDAGVDPAAFGITLLTDFAGNPRPQGAGYDIGADEQ